MLPEASAALYETLRKVGGMDASPNGPDRSSRVPGFVKRGPMELHAAKISPDGRWLMNIDWEGSRKTGITAALFDLHDQRETAPRRRWVPWPAGSEIFRAWCWLADSRGVVTVRDNGEIMLWTVTPAEGTGTVDEPPPGRVLGFLGITGRKLKELALLPRKEGNQVEIVSFFSPPEGEDQDSRGICVRQLLTPGAPVPLESGNRMPLPASPAVTTGRVVSPDGKWVLSVGIGRAGRGYLQNLDAGPGEKPVELPEGEFYVGPVIYSPDSRHLLLYRDPGIVRIYDLISGDPAASAGTGRTLCRQVQGCIFLAFSPDCRTVCLAGVGDQLQLQPLDPSQPVANLRTDGKRNIVAAFSPDGEWFFAGGHDRVVRAWRRDRLEEADAPLQFRGLPTPVMDIQMAADGRSLVATGLNGAFRRWAFDGLSTGAQPSVVSGNEGPVNDLAVSTDSRWIALACGPREGAGGGAGSGEVWLSPGAGDGSWRLASLDFPATGVAFSRDGRWLAVAGKSASAMIFDVPAAVQARAAGRPPPGPRHVLGMEGTRPGFERRVAFHPRGTLYCTSGDGMLFEWNLSEAGVWGQMHVLHSILYLLPDVEVSPDGHWLAVCRHGWDPNPEPGSTQCMNMVLLYDVSAPGSPVPRATLPASFLESTNVVFSADSRWMAAGAAGAEPFLWDLERASPGGAMCRVPVTGHALEALAFSPDRPWLAVGGNEGEINLWHRLGGADRSRFFTGDKVRSLQWLPGGRLLSGGVGGHAFLWETDISTLVALARKVAGRELTDAERKAFRTSPEDSPPVTE